jgi:hypothetical protein
MEETYSIPDALEVLRLFGERYLTCVDLSNLPAKKEVFTSPSAGLDECAAVILSRIDDARDLDKTRLGPTPGARREKKFPRTNSFENSPVHAPAPSRREAEVLGGAEEGSALFVVPTPEKTAPSPTSSAYEMSPILRTQYSADRSTTPSARVRREPGARRRREPLDHASMFPSPKDSLALFPTPKNSSTPAGKGAEQRSEEDSFNDIGPSPKSRYALQRPKFRHVTSPVRKKAERKLLTGHTCKDCAAFFATMSESKREEMLQKCARHRALNPPTAGSPKCPWETFISDSPIPTQEFVPFKNTRASRAAALKAKRNLDMNL